MEEEVERFASYSQVKTTSTLCSVVETFRNAALHVHLVTFQSLM